MAFSNYLIKFGSGNGAFTITGEKYVEYNTYEAVRKVQDLDPYRDANGVLHRNALSHVPVTIKFNTLRLTNTEFATLVNGISSNYSNAQERKVLVTAYVPETDSYISQDMYWAEPQIKIQNIDLKNNVIIYAPMTMEFIGY
jgi:hypothetical protein